MEESVASFGLWLRRRRKALDLTQDDLASAVGCSKELIAKIEQDARRPSRQVAELLARALQIDMADQALFVRAARAELAVDQLPSPMAGVPQPRLSVPSIGQAPPPSPPPSPPPRRTNLPAPQNTLIGRTHETAAVTALLGTARLVTLTGPGGTGKTRLAVHVATLLADQYADGVWFVDLSPVSEDEPIVAALTHTLGIPDSAEQSREAGLHAWIRGRQTLLVLDNCEQVIDSVAALTSALLRESGALTILATSRIPLRVVAEQEYPVAPLALPDTSTLPPLDQLSQYDAVALFIVRARAVQPAFTVTNANAPAVAAICAQLDGLPLAIELAAARLRIFSPEQLLARLGATQLQLLVGGARDLPTRQQTIRATIDWSYQLLSPPQQHLLARLGVFVGGWTLEAAEAVCGDPDLDPATELEALAAQSLVLVSDHHGTIRYTMLETIRAYAIERLQQLGEVKRLREQHTHSFIALAKMAEPELHRRHQVAWLDRLASEHDNLRAALDWAYQTADIQGLHGASALAEFWRMRGAIVEGTSQLERFLAQHTNPSIDRGRGLCHLGRLYHALDPQLVARSLRESLAIGCRFADQRLIADSLAALAMSGNLPDTSFFTAIQFPHHPPPCSCLDLYQSALATYRDLNDSYNTARVLNDIAWEYEGIGERERAIAIGTEALRLFEQVGDLRGIADTLQTLGRIHHFLRRFEEAVEHLQRSAAFYAQLGDQTGMWSARVAVSDVFQVTGRLAEAGEILKAFLKATEHSQLPWQQAWGMNNYAEVLFASGDYAQAKQLFVGQLLLRHTHGVAVDLITAMGLIGLAGVAAIEGMPDRGARWVGAARTLESLEELPAEHDQLYRQVLQLIQRALDHDRFEAALTEGSASDWQDAVRDAVAFATRNQYR